MLNIHLSRDFAKVKGNCGFDNVNKTMRIYRDSVGDGSTYIYYDIYNAQIGDEIVVTYELVNGDKPEIALDFYNEDGYTAADFKCTPGENDKYIMEYKFYVRTYSPLNKHRVTLGFFADRIGRCEVKNFSVSSTSANATSGYEPATKVVVLNKDGSGSGWVAKPTYSDEPVTLEQYDDYYLKVTYRVPFTGVPHGVVSVCPSASGRHDWDYRVKSQTKEGFLFCVIGADKSPLRIGGAVRDDATSLWVGFVHHGFN